jgi:hypothetical protein
MHGPASATADSTCKTEARADIIVPRGNAGDEVIDQGFNFTNARRRSNSSSLSSNPDHLKTKFEVNEPEPVFEESMGPEDEEEKTESSSSGTSVDEAKSHKDM